MGVEHRVGGGKSILSMAESQGPDTSQGHTLLSSVTPYLIKL